MEIYHLILIATIHVTRYQIKCQNNSKSFTFIFDYMYLTFGFIYDYYMVFPDVNNFWLFGEESEDFAAEILMLKDKFFFKFEKIHFWYFYAFLIFVFLLFDLHYFLNFIRNALKLLGLHNLLLFFTWCRLWITRKRRKSFPIWIDIILIEQEIVAILLWLYAEDICMFEIFFLLFE